MTPLLPTYDIVIMNNYLEHTLRPAAEISKAYDLLVAGGKLIGEIPNFRAFDRVLFRRFWGGNHVPRHTFHFTPATLERALADRGFTNIRITQQFNSSHFALSFQNWMQRNRRNLRHNPSIVHGRSRYFPYLLVLLSIPNALCALAGWSGLMRFIATKP